LAEEAGGVALLGIRIPPLEPAPGAPDMPDIPGIPGIFGEAAK